MRVVRLVQPIVVDVPQLDVVNALWLYDRDLFQLDVQTYNYN